MLSCRAYVDDYDSDEAEIRALADSIYLRVDWPCGRAAGARTGADNLTIDVAWVRCGDV